MRTTIRLDEALLRDAKELAARSGQTLTAVIEEALRKALASKEARKERRPLSLPTFAGNGLQPGVDLDDSASLLELMEERRDPHRR
jgi:hypothetical protein